MAEQDFEKMPLTPYDEYPVHTTPFPMSYVPNTDFAWDDGYFFMIYDLASGTQVWNGMRFAPNSNMVGGHSAFNIRGVQRTLRISRIWRDDFSVSVGPLRYEFLEPLRAVRMVLEPNESRTSYDLLWTGLAPAHLSQHHRAIRNGRFTTDQSRYNQVGTATGWIEIDGQRIEISPDKPWGGSRDRSWGIYESRPPLHGAGKYLPPVPPPPMARALRFSCFLEGKGLSSYFHFHEGPDGENVVLNDAFGTPFEGWINFGWAGKQLKLVSHSHDLQWRPETRSMTAGRIVLTDEDGGEWALDMVVNHPPHVLGQIGYHVGAWTDGGTIHTYHGANPAMEWDEYDFSVQPCDHTFPGTGETRKVFGVEHITDVMITSPDGAQTQGRAQIEIFLNGRYSRYGFEDQSNHGGLTGRGIA
jgi:hypothetical protein